MSLFHRFCAFIPLFLTLGLLAGCSAGGMPDPWVSSGSARTSDPAPSSVYGTPSSTSPALSSLPSVQGQQTVKVAILLPLTGQHAAIGQSMLQAAQLAVFDVGYDNFELVSKDTGGTPQGAASAANAAITEGATLILGPLFAEEVRAVGPIARGRNVNVLGFSTDWTLAGGNVYLMGFTPFNQVERIAQYAAKTGLTRMAVAAPADQYGLTVSRGFETEAARNGITIAPALSNPSSYDAVFIPAGSKELPSVLPRISNTSAKKLGTGLWDDPQVTANPSMNGALFAAPAPSARRGFEGRYQSTYGVAPMRIASIAYDASALAAAFAKNGTPYDASALGNPAGFAGIDGVMRFNNKNLMERGMAVLEIRNGQIVEIDPAPRSF